MPRTGFSVGIDGHKVMNMGIRAFVKKPSLRRQPAAAVQYVFDC